jgi:fluoroquinolone transport system permease protein
MFIIPVAMVLICRLCIPRLSEIVPVLPDYYWLILASLTSVTASTPAFLIGFILLDERDENVHTILKILPLPTDFILKCRIFFMIFLGFIFSFFILFLNGLIRPDLWFIILLSLLMALIPPILTFSIISFAKNKIEAATMYKGLSMFLFLPVVAFFIQGGWHFLFGVIPFFWTYSAFQVVGDPLKFLMFFIISGSIHTVFIGILYRLYKRKIV